MFDLKLCLNSLQPFVYVQAERPEEVVSQWRETIAGANQKRGRGQKMPQTLDDFLMAVIEGPNTLYVRYGLGPTHAVFLHAGGPVTRFFELAARKYEELDDDRFVFSIVLVGTERPADVVPENLRQYFVPSASVVEGRTGVEVPRTKTLSREEAFTLIEQVAEEMQLPSPVPDMHDDAVGLFMGMTRTEAKRAMAFSLVKRRSELGASSPKEVANPECIKAYRYRWSLCG